MIESMIQLDVDGLEVDGVPRDAIFIDIWDIVSIDFKLRREILDLIAAVGCTGVVVWRWSGSPEIPWSWHKAIRAVDESLERDLTPQLMLFNIHTTGPQRFDPRQMDWRRQIDETIRWVEDRPLIWELMRECSGALVDWQREAVRYLRRKDPLKRHIHVNAGFGRGGMTAEELLLAGADSVAYLEAPGWTLEEWKRRAARDGQFVFYATDHHQPNADPSFHLPLMEEAHRLGMGVAYMDGYESETGKVEVIGWDGPVEKYDPEVWETIGGWARRGGEAPLPVPPPEPPPPEPGPPPAPGPPPDPEPPTAAGELKDRLEAALQQAAPAARAAGQEALESELEAMWDDPAVRQQLMDLIFGSLGFDVSELLEDLVGSIRKRVA